VRRGGLPMPSSSALDRARMNPAEFDNIAGSERTFWWYRGMQRILFRLLDPVAEARRCGRVLEAGCGTGYLSKLLEERYGWEMFPVDLGIEGLRYAQAMRVERPAQCDIAALPFPSGSFDAVVSMDVIVHFPRGAEVRPVAEFARVLRPGGMLAIRVSALDWLRSRHSMFAEERQRFTRTRLVRLLEDQGFRVTRCTYANSLLLPVALAKFRIWEPLTRAEPSSGVTPVAPWLDRLLYTPLSAEAALIGAGINLPLGQSLIAIAEKTR
jgi:SAM-dependent methyltransferase